MSGSDDGTPTTVGEPWAPCPGQLLRWTVWRPFGYSPGTLGYMWLLWRPGRSGNGMLCARVRGPFGQCPRQDSNLRRTV
jgi:hypothetical protein